MKAEGGKQPIRFRFCILHSAFFILPSLSAPSASAAANHPALTTHVVEAWSVRRGREAWSVTREAWTRPTAHAPRLTVPTFSFAALRESLQPERSTLAKERSQLRANAMAVLPDAGIGEFVVIHALASFRER